MTLRFVNARTGAIVSEKSLLLTVPGAQGTPADPCLSTTAAAIAAAGAQSAPGVQALPSSVQPLVVVGTVIINRGNPFLSPAPLVTASLQVRAANSVKAVETIPLAPTNLVTSRRQQMFLAHSAVHVRQ